MASFPRQPRPIGVLNRTLHEDVFTTVGVFEATGATTDEAFVDELVARGYDPLKAELLAVFVPMGLARAVIAHLHANPPIHLSENAIVYDFENSEQLLLKLASVPEFEAARHVGEETFAIGVIPRELFSWVVGFSVELKLLNRMLDAGGQVDGATISAPVLARLADAPGSAEWYATVSGRSHDA